MDASEPGGLIEDVGGVAKEMISLLTFSEGLGAILETAMWELQSALFSLGKRWESIKILIGPDLMHCIRSLTDCMDLVSMQCTM